MKRFLDITINVSGTTISRNGNGIFCSGRNIGTMIGSCLSGSNEG